MTIFIVHILQNWFYVSKLPKLVASRNKERAQLRKAKLTLKWFDPISASDAKEAGIRVYEAYKM